VRTRRAERRNVERRPENTPDYVPCQGAGTALPAAHADVHSSRILLSRIAEVAIPSTTTTSTPAASLPIPVTLAAVTTSTADVAAFSVRVMSAWTTTETGSLPSIQLLRLPLQALLLLLLLMLRHLLLMTLIGRVESLVAIDH
jgi:hypothetical protein